MSPAASESQHSVSVKKTCLQTPWELFVIPVSQFPAPADEFRPIKILLQKLTRMLRQERGLALEVFVQLSHLHQDGGAGVLAKMGRQWMPKLGLGIWPDRPAPTFWTREDFINLAPGQRPRSLMDQVLQITSSQEVAEEASNVLLGRGTVVQMLTPLGVQLLEKTREVLLAPIKDPSFTCFPFYVPLLENKSLSGDMANQLEEWLGGAAIYLRESAEDKCILIVSREPLETMLRSIGAEVFG